MADVTLAPHHAEALRLDALADADVARMLQDALDWRDELGNLKPSYALHLSFGECHPREARWHGAVSTAIRWGIAPVLLGATLPIAVTIFALAMPPLTVIPITAFVPGASIEALNSLAASPLGSGPASTGLASSALPALPAYTESLRGAGDFATSRLARVAAIEEAPTIAVPAAPVTVAALADHARPIATPVSLPEPATSIPLRIPVSLAATVPRDSLLFVTGVPPGAKLSSGHLLDASGIWVIEPIHAASLTMTAAAPLMRRHHLSVDVLPADGMMSTLALITIEPPAAPPLARAQQAAIPEVRPETRTVTANAPLPRPAKEARIARTEETPKARPARQDKPQRVAASANAPETARPSLTASRKVAAAATPGKATDELPVFRPAATPKPRVVVLPKGTAIARGDTKPPTPAPPPARKSDPVWTQPWARSALGAGNGP